jgi:hypothetical protein
MRYYSRVNADRRRQAAEHLADLLSPETPPESNETRPDAASQLALDHER